MMYLAAAPVQQQSGIKILLYRNNAPIFYSGRTRLRIVFFIYFFFFNILYVYWRVGGEFAVVKKNNK